ncbi:uncharacterized protein EV422DRAFT_578211 [Fimicolochytrium jonesii]|uniref:uncharacterized protein n=1 Tax=Fimicolochytrium jonesii TaxID=1396493 RepID=UPI0022FF1524|nr:uncharacterized protein EV422DRAFT_578211 [Fimicolochytrium jonesii]KAI8821354.1 hypothetical protein EV422DRAFT_578211 [Fimicolochytrium jonesii]
MRCTLLATCALGALTTVPSTTAFWLIPGSSHSHHDVTPSQDTRGGGGFLRKLMGGRTSQDRTNIMSEGVKHPSMSSETGVPSAMKDTSMTAEDEGVMADLLKALSEMYTDLGYTTTLAKEQLSRGIYLRQTDDVYMLAMDVPGLHTNEVTVSADKGILKIKGEHKCADWPLKGVMDDSGKPKTDPLCIGRYYDASFTFPSDAEEEKAEANLDAGVVKVVVPKLKGEKRGIHRVLKLGGDAAGWVYEGTGAKAVAEATTDTARNAYDAAAQGAQRVVDTVMGAGRDTADGARNVADQATASAMSAANAATNMGAQATDSAATAVPSMMPGEDNKGFVERIHEQYVKPIKDRIIAPGQGGSEGAVPVVNKEEL